MRYLYDSSNRPTGYTSLTSLTIGQEYYIKVYPLFVSDSYYWIVFNTSSNAPPLNATPITVGVWGSSRPISFGQEWLKLTATTNIYYMHATGDYAFVLYVQVYDSNNNTVGSEITFNNKSTMSLPSLAVGQEYYIKISPNDRSGSTFINNHYYKIAFTTSSTPPAQ